MNFELTEHRVNRNYLGIAALTALVVLCGIGLFDPAPALSGYLAAYLFWLSVPLGCGALMMLSWLIPGRWLDRIMPLLVAGVSTGILSVPFFIPLAMGAFVLYPWTAIAHEAGAISDIRASYLNIPFFMARAGIYLAVWTVGGWMLCRLWRTDCNGPKRSNAAGAASAGMIIYVFTMSFAAIDWVGSLEQHWYSSIFGLYLIVGQALLGLTLAMLASLTLSYRGERIASPVDARQDQGTLLLTLVSLHAYIAFSQFLIIWNGNLPHEITWYVHRSSGVWAVVCFALLLAHFGLPFVILLSRERKRSRRWLRFACITLLVMRAVECGWMVLPPADRPALATMAAVIAWVGIGAVWLAALLSKMATLVNPVAGSSTERIQTA